jgi:pyruvate ferredoxin oxidoreductase alpha subunit
VVRPFPAEVIAHALTGRKAVAVIDQNLAPGAGGITYPEIVTALYGEKNRPPVLSVIGGLGGKDISDGEFEVVLGDLERAANGERVVSPRLLYTTQEYERTRALLKVAGKELPM